MAYERKSRSTGSSGRRGHSSSRSYSQPETSRHAFLFFVFPTILTILFAVAGIGYNWMFRYNAGNAQYRFGAQGYNVKGQNVAYGLTWMYDLPQGFASPVTRIPTLLLGHFILALILGLYVVARLWVHRKVRDGIGGRPMSSCRWMAAVAYLLAAACLGMVFGDAFILIDSAIKRHTGALQFDMYGWFFAVCTTLCSGAWAAVGFRKWGFRLYKEEGIAFG